MKKFISFTLTLLTLMLIISSAEGRMVEATSQDADGSFNTVGFNNAPQVLRFQGPLAQGTGALTPQQVYTVLIEVEDRDGIRDLESLELRFYYAATGGGIEPNSLEEVEDIFASNDRISPSGEALVMRWENNGGAWESPETTVRPDNPMSGFQMVVEDASGSLLNDGSGRRFGGVTHASVTWEIVNSTVPAIGANPGVIEGTTFVFEVSFRISKVAPETNFTLWRLGTLIKDARTIITFDEDQLNDGFSSFPTLKTSNVNPLPQNDSLSPTNADAYSMNFYAEIDLAQDMIADWNDPAYDNTIQPAIVFADDNHVSLPGIQYISNSTFTRQIQTDPQWSATRSATVGEETYFATIQHAPLISSSIDRFRMAAQEHTAVFDRDTAIILRENNEKANFNNVSRTFEVGIAFDYFLFLELSQSFQNGIYQGNIILTVTNTLN